MRLEANSNRFSFFLATRRCKRPNDTSGAGRTSEKRSMIDFGSHPQTMQLTSLGAPRDNPVYQVGDQLEGGSSTSSRDRWVFSFSSSLQARSHSCDRRLSNRSKACERVSVRPDQVGFQSPTSCTPIMIPSSISVSRDRRLQMTVLPGGGSWT
jgi:hypothetical protein